ncbi:potassium channel family protein [Streptomyces griseorubiginosus]|uniref:potassium channel family protein n=2 Tax=Streptomyces griseorubiginosus TaxID=67304 RepID=UPI003646EFFC
MDDDTGTHPDDDHEGHGTGGLEGHGAGGHEGHGTDRPPRTGAGPDADTSPTAHAPGTSQRLTLWEERTEILLGVASMAFLGAYALRVLVPGLPQAALDLCLAVTLAAWALFAVDYAVRWRLSGQGRRFVRRHVLDTVVLILPLLRPLRIVKVYETVQRRHGEPRLPLHGRVIAYSGLSTLLLGFTGALAVFQQERDAPGTTMPTFGDAVWWTCATLTTVGYGDVVPVTPLGRLIAVGVMMIGLALLASVTGTFASWLLQVFAREDDERPPGI